MNTTLPHNHSQSTETLLKEMPDHELFLEAASMFQQISDGSRLRIFFLLCHCEECVYNIAAALGMTSASVSHHLKTLKLHGLITCTRVGKEMHYTLAKNEKAQLLHRLVEDYFQITCPHPDI